MATKLCQQCRAQHPGRECDYDPATGQCAETSKRCLDCHVVVYEDRSACLHNEDGSFHLCKDFS